MQNAKVCHLTTAHPPFDVRIFHKECHTLVNAGYKVSLIAQHNKGEIVDRIKIVPLPNVENRIQRMFSLPVKAFSLALKQKADIYHFHDPELLPIGVILKIFMRKKVIYDVHEDYKKQILSKSYIPKIARKSIAFFTKIIEYLSSKFFDGVITATDDILKNFSFHKKAITLNNFPIKIAQFPDGKVNRNNNRDVFNLIYTGGLDRTRGITQMVEALELVDSRVQVRLTLCGKFYPTNYEKKISNLKGFKKVNYLGWIQLNRIPELLRESDAAIVCFLPEPNHINAMPNKLFESMAACIPVIGSNFTLWRYIIEGNNCGLCIDPLDPRSIASAIQNLIEHPKEARKMGENGYKIVNEKYNWANEERKLLTMYKGI